METPQPLALTKPAYVPQKLREMATKLTLDENVDACLAQLRQQYPKLCSLRTALSKLKMAVLETNKRHPTYHDTMAAWEEHVKQRIVEKNASPESLQRIKDFYNFQSCDLKRQLHIQKKIKLGQANDMFSHPQDLEFAASIKVAPDYVGQLHLNDEETKAVQEQQATQAMVMSSTVVRIENADDLVRHARRVLKGGNDADTPVPQTICDLAIALALTTGRRMIEIFQKGQFSEVPGQKYAVLFTGQAKAGLQEIVGLQQNKMVEYTIPVLAPAAHIIRSIAVLRGLGQTLTKTPKKINSEYCHRLNTQVRRHVHADLGFHDLRTLYALISFEVFKPHTFGLNGWVCNTLGHTGLGMSVAYTRMQVYGINKIRRHNRELTEDF